MWAPRVIESSEMAFFSSCHCSRRHLVLLLIACLTLWTAAFRPARADEIDSFDVTMRAFKDSTLQVQEKILVRFDEPRHGIFRDIPIVYTRQGGDYSLDFHLDTVKDERGNSQPFVCKQQGREISVRVGQADQEISGEHFYVITYTLRRAVNFFSGKPEIYWNVTGSKWPYAINHAGLELRLPEGVSSFDCQTASYVGPPGSTAAGGQIRRPSRQQIYFDCAKLNPGEEFTVVAGLPAGAMFEPPLLLRVYWYLLDWWAAVVFPLLTIFGLYATWRHLGRDAEPNGPVAVDWSPPKELTPAEVGTLIDERCDLKDVLVCIIDLAARGYLLIKEVEDRAFLFKNRSYVFVRRFGEDIAGSTLRLEDAELRDYERTMLRGVFDADMLGYLVTEVALDELRERFFVYIPKITRMIYDEVSSRSLFVDDPATVRNNYVTIGVVIGFIGILGLARAFGFDNAPAFLGIILSGVVFCFFAPAMPARTLAGVKLRRQALGFALFARKAEKRRLEMMTKEDPTIFGRLLPYAIVLGAADAWANAFDGLAVEPPSWYQSSDPGYVFSTRTFTSDMGSSMNSMQMVLPSAPSTSSAGSGGSGFSGGGSGGGFGGGGGGSW
jgi:uncharacterized membrane protein YgcG